MVSSFVITITEVDDAEMAVEELKAQMALFDLKKNTIGIVSAHLDFIDSGVYAAVVEAVPFQLVGMTTFSQAAGGKAGLFLFSILVLTSDDCGFSCGSSAAVVGGADISEVMRECYADVKSGLDGEPKLAFLYSPFPEDELSGAACRSLRAISAQNGDLPIFGSLACCELEKLHEAKVVCGADVSSEHCALVLISGEVSPEFFVGATTKEAVIVSVVGVVTAAEEDRLLEINGMNVKRFFEQMDYFIGKDLNEAALSTLMIAETKDENGEVLSCRAQGILSLTDEYAILEDFIETGTKLSLAALTKGSVMATTEEAVSWIKKRGGSKTALIYSCLGRWIAAADESDKEYGILSGGLEGSCYQASYSGGEICPVLSKGGKLLNAKHSSSIVVCVF